MPTSWADSFRRWDGYHAPEEAPRIVDPPRERIWTANGRVVSGEALEVATEPDMLAIQLDDLALFLALAQPAAQDVDARGGRVRPTPGRSAVTSRAGAAAR